MAVEFEIKTDNTEEAIRELETKIQAALEAVGNQAVSHAKQNITAGVPRNADSWYTPTGNLKNSMTHIVKGDTCYVGTNNEYAIYNELGTGVYADGGKGRKTPWMYKDDQGNVHITRGMKPLHFLKNAVMNNIKEYKAIFEQYLKR